MPKKVSELFSNLFSKSRQPSTSSTTSPTHDGGELVTDAAPLDDVYASSQQPDDEKKEVELFDEMPAEMHSGAVAIIDRQRQGSSQLATGSTEPMMRNDVAAFSPNVKSNLDVEPFQMPGLDVIRDPGLGSSPAIHQPLAVNNTQGYNVFQFSQISGLHIGSVYNITHEASSASSEMRPNRTDEPFRRTKTIEGSNSNT